MIRQTLKMSWNAIRSNKLRSFLTMLGIIIGVVALVVLVSIASGATSSVEDEISGIGSNYLTVRISDDKENPITYTEFTTLITDEEIGAAAPAGTSSVTAKSGYTSGTMTLTGTTGGYAEIMDLVVQYGRFLKNTDQDNHSNVVVITADTAVEFFGHADAEGETLSLDGKKFLVVGVIETESSSSGFSMGSSSESGASTVSLEGYIPYTTLCRMSDSIKDVTQFYVSSASEKSMDGAEETVKRIMLERLKDDEDAFTIQNQSDIMEAARNVSNTMALMLGGIAAISLLVGGIGIMNIMLVSVTERTREIGIRKAIGAGRGSIMFQFLMEALILSLLGCVIGVGASLGILEIIEMFMGDTMSFQMSWQTAGAAAGFSVIIGAVFGWYPASQAARKKPIDALRYSG